MKRPHQANGWNGFWLAPTVSRKRSARAWRRQARDWHAWGNGSGAYFPEDREAGFVLLCTAKACSDLHIRAHQEEKMRAHRVRHDLPAPYA